MSSVLANFIIRPSHSISTIQTPDVHWSLWMVVQGIEWQVGPFIAANDAQEAAAKFAQMLITQR